MESQGCILLILPVMVQLMLADSTHLTTHPLSRHKRKLPLLFNDFGVSQFVCGFGVPVDLELETVTTGIVFKSQLPLPATPMDLRNLTTHNINGRAVKNLNIPTLMNRLRWDFYKSLESWATNAGFDGRTCTLRALCEAAQIPFSEETGDLWHDIAHILFAPLSSVDILNHHSGSEYLAASRIGSVLGNNCGVIFKDCKKSLLTVFTQIF